MYYRAVAREERHHLSITRMVPLTVVRCSDQEQRTRIGMRLPPGPRAFPVAETRQVTERLHQWRVELKRFFEVIGADENMREHFTLPIC